MAAQARVERRVKHIHRQISQHEHRHHHQGKALDHRVIAIENGGNRVAADPGLGKDIFDNHGAADQLANVHAHGGHHRQGGIAQDMSALHLARAQSA